MLHCQKPMSFCTLQWFLAWNVSSCWGRLRSRPHKGNANRGRYCTRWPERWQCATEVWPLSLPDFAIPDRGVFRGDPVQRPVTCCSALTWFQKRRVPPRRIRWLTAFPSPVLRLLLYPSQPPGHRTRILCPTFPIDRNSPVRCLFARSSSPNIRPRNTCNFFSPKHIKNS